MATPLDPTRKRDLSLPQQIGRNARQAVNTTFSGFSAANPIAVGLRGFNDAVPRLHEGVREGLYGFTNPEATSAPSIARPAAIPVRNPVSKVLTGGVPASVPRPDFSGVRGNVRVPAAPAPAIVPPAQHYTGIQRTMVNGVPTFTGTGAFAPQNPMAAPAVSHPALAAPSIAPVMQPGVTNQSENTDQRRARETAISEIGTQLFLNRGKTTRIARDVTEGLLRTQADLTNTAGNQAVALKNNNLDAQTRMDVVGLQNQGENDRALIGERGANARALLSDTGDTERERIKLQRPPSLATDADGLLLSVDGSIARAVTNYGSPVRLHRRRHKHRPRRPPPGFFQARDAVDGRMPPMTRRERMTFARQLERVRIQDEQRRRDRGYPTP